MGAHVAPVTRIRNEKTAHGLGREPLLGHKKTAPTNAGAVWLAFQQEIKYEDGQNYGG